MKVGPSYGISVLRKRDQRACSLSFSIRRHSKNVAVSISQEEGPHQELCPDLRLPASRTVRNKCLLFKPFSLWYSVITAINS